MELSNGINKIYKECLKNDEDYDINDLVVFYRGERVDENDNLLARGVPFAFAHRELGICPFKAIDNDLLYDVDWYDALKQEWLDPVEVLFANEKNSQNPSTKLASALVSWLSELSAYSISIGNKGRLNTIVVDSVIRQITDCLSDAGTVATQPLQLTTIECARDNAPRKVLNTLTDQGVSDTIIDSISFGFAIPNVFTKKLLAVHKDMLPSLDRFGIRDVDPDIRFLPPLRRAFVSNIGEYYFECNNISFSSTGERENEIINVSILIHANLHNGSTVTIKRCMRYSVSTGIRFLANCQYISVWPSAKIDMSLWQKYYVGVFEGIKTRFEFSWRGSPIDEKNIYTQSEEEQDKNKIDFRPAVRENEANKLHKVSSNIGNVPKDWDVHTTTSFPDYIAVLINENEANQSIEYGIIPVIPKNIIKSNNKSYCIAVDFGTTNTHCAIGERNPVDRFDYPETITTSDGMLPIELSYGADKQKHKKHIDEISTRYWIPRETSAADDYYFSSACQLFSDTNVTRNVIPLIDGRIIDLSADVFEGIYTNEEKRRSLDEEKVYASMKIITNAGDSEYNENNYAIRVFLVNVLMNAALYAIIEKGAPIPLNIGFSFPDAKTGQYVSDSFKSAITSLNAFAGCQVFSGVNDPSIISEALSVSKYHELKKDGAIGNEGFITVDIGGGTADVCISKKHINDPYTTNRGSLSFRFAGRVATIESIRDILRHAPNNRTAPHNIFTLSEQIFKNTRNNQKLIEAYADLSNQYLQAVNTKDRKQHSFANTLTPIIEALIRSCGFKDMSADVNNDIMTLRSVLRSKFICIIYLIAKYFRQRATYSHIDSNSREFDYRDMETLEIFLAGNGARLVSMCGLGTKGNLKVLSEIFRECAKVPPEIGITIRFDPGELKKEVSNGLIYYMRLIAESDNKNAITERYITTVEESKPLSPKKDKLALFNAYDDLLDIMKNFKFENSKDSLYLNPPQYRNSWTIYDALNREDPTVNDIFTRNSPRIEGDIIDNGFPECIYNEAFAVLMFNEILTQKSSDLFAK